MSESTDNISDDSIFYSEHIKEGLILNKKYVLI